VVIGLQSTGEAAADAAGLEPGPVPGFVSTTRELLARFMATHFPVAREVSAEGGLWPLRGCFSLLWAYEQPLPPLFVSATGSNGSLRTGPARISQSKLKCCLE
jgi:hypothetical protein